ncbi:alkaline phosphatase [Pseudomethylobacillus aquaticus]|uniref:Alkaline phosphatase n=1 Tax=Pseudomethylobacillus aquaticus TaxID=2676064 RepID=A0A3N0V1G3_9PROT|nr:alkaline phosphatase [Pseudomethylobacillus aquaticus]ROH86394.1 alkaline phosphatase [Pseudomethylobacillus aquaticus]
MASKITSSGISSLLGGIIFISAITVHAEPAVRGPEQVQDWQKTGLAFLQTAAAQQTINKTAKNIILFVGDGMGLSTVTAARILQGQQQGKPGEENQLAFERFPYLALSKTYSWDQQTPDSAPTMTAIVTGYKAREGMLSVNHLTARAECDAAKISANSLPTLLEQSAQAGKATGIVTTTRITHATPAANYAHTAMRDWEADSDLPPRCGVKDIARQLIEASPAVRNSLKVVLGGGRAKFMRVDQLDPEYPNKRGARKDGRDLLAEWQALHQQGVYVTDNKGFKAADSARFDTLLGLFEPSHMQYEADRLADKAGEPSLTEMTEKAIQRLQRSPKGYFLQIEAGRIDHAHHAGNAKRALLDTIMLSDAVARARAMTSVEDTLIIVTADHSHTLTLAGYPHRGNPILGVVKDVPEQDGAPVSESKDELGLNYTTLGYANGPGAQHPRHAITAADSEDVEYQQAALVPLKSETHGGEDVAIFASGPQAHLFRGVMEQNWIYYVMRHAFGF